MELSLNGSWLCSLERIDEYDVLTNASFHVETVVLMSKANPK